MRELVLKDLYTQKIYIYGTSLMWFIIFTNFFTDGSPLRHVILLIFLAYWFAISTNSNTKSFEGESVLINSLPRMRSQVVLAKYTSSIIWFVLSTVMVLVYVLLFDTLAPFPTRMMTVPELILSLCAFYLLISVYYPILFTFGTRLASILSVFFVFFVIIGSQMAINIMENPRLTFMDGFDEWIVSPKFLFIFVVVSIVITWISYLISAKVYESKDL